MYPEGQDILVVDSDEGRRGAIARILVEEGFAVTPVGEGLAAVRAAAQRDYALAVIGLDLPGALDGPATLRQARLRQRRLKGLFVGGCAHMPRWAGPAADEFLLWPSHRWELLGCVFELLQRDGAAAADLGRRCRTELRAG
jgi:DNA-binding response OmpR family regulator